MAEFLDDEFRGIGVDRLVLRDHHAVLHQRLDHIPDPFSHPVGQFRDHDDLGQLHVAHDLFALLHTTHRLLARAFLLALHRGHGFLPSAFAARERLIERKLARTADILTATALAAAGLLIVVFALARCGGRFGRGLTRGRGRCIGRCGGSGRSLDRGLFRHALAALVLGGLGASTLFGLALFAFLGLGLFPATQALFLAGLFIRLALRGLFGFACLGGRERLHPAFHLRISDPGRAL